MKRMPNKLTHKNRRAIVGGIIVSCIIFVVAGLAIIPQTVFGAAGPGNAKPSAAGCKEGTTSGYWDICYGATWRYYKWGQKSKTFVGGKAKKSTPVVQTSASGNTVGGPITGCTKADGFFVLGMEAYKRNGSGTGTKNATSLGYQVGISQVKKMKPAGGNYNFVVVKGSKDWKEAQKAFNEALKKNQTGNYKKFAGTLGWFCSDDPDDEPDDEKVTTPKTKGSFWSWSGIKIPKQGSDAEAHEAESDPNSDVTIKLSTNEPQLTVDFYHKMSYSDELWDSSHKGCWEEDDKYDDIDSKWEVEYTEDASGSAGSDAYHTGGSGSNQDQQVSTTNGYVIKLEPGETKKVCQKITYDSAIVNLGSEIVYRTDADGNKIRRYYHFSESSSSGTDFSQSCVEVTRPRIPGTPEDPQYPDPRPGTTAGGTDNKVFFAGETGTVGWNYEIPQDGYNVNTRRFAALEATTFDVSYGVDYDTKMNEGEKNWKGEDVCSFYLSQRHGRTCDNSVEYYVENQPNDKFKFPDPNPINESHTVVIPNTVGDKYCNGLGYKFEYWWGIEKEGKTEWHREDDKTYWTAFAPKCRTIAKKPSSAVWNGSTISQGNLIGSTSWRFTNPQMHDEIDEDDEEDRYTYGTWSEYLNVVGLNIQGVASGAAFARGSGSTSIMTNSPLTISNTNGLLGHSGVMNNSSYRTRLETFLKNNRKIGVHEVNNVNDAAGGDTSGTRVYKISGNQTLSNNIVYPNGPYTKIYDLPQTIIFVDGNLDIASNVTRIDAWLIVSGTINTCSNFRSGSTEASPSDVCSNQLAINGPIIANKITPNRSYGSTTTGSGDSGSASQGFSPSTTEIYSPAKSSTSAKTLTSGLTPKLVATILATPKSTHASWRRGTKPLSYQRV